MERSNAVLRNDQISRAVQVGEIREIGISDEIWGSNGI
jgi:hypothetical protein